MSFGLRTTLLTSMGASLALGAMVASCSDDKPPISGGTTSGGVLDGSVGAPDGARLDGSSSGSVDSGQPPDGATPLSCNTLERGGPQVGQTVIVDTPQPLGGTIVPGTYWLTGREVYNGATDGSLVRRSLLIDDKRINVSEELVSDPASASLPVVTTGTSTYQTFGNAGLSAREACPGSPTVTNGRYTAEPDRLTIYYPDLDIGDVYTKK
jgi:hypothetical protein